MLYRIRVGGKLTKKVSAKEGLLSEAQTRQEIVSAKESLSNEAQTSQEIVSAKISKPDDLQTAHEICRPPTGFADRPPRFADRPRDLQTAHEICRQVCKLCLQKYQK